MIEEILTMISEGESETVEFKKSTGLLREIIETVCAFANRRGGYLFIGVEDEGKIVGQQVTDDTLKNIANAVKLNTDSKLYPNIEKIEIQGKTCILVTVEESPLKPHSAYGKPFLRVGPSNQQIDRQQYEYMLQQRINGYGFDNQIQADSGLSDIDTESLYEFVELANSVRNMNENIFLPPDIILEKLELSKNHSVTKAGMLLFGKKPDFFFQIIMKSDADIFQKMRDMSISSMIKNSAAILSPTFIRRSVLFRTVSEKQLKKPEFTEQNHGNFRCRLSERRW